MLAYLEALKGAVVTGMVGGSDLPKQLEQLGDGGASRRPKPRLRAPTRVPSPSCGNDANYT